MTPLFIAAHYKYLPTLILHIVPMIANVLFSLFHVPMGVHRALCYFKVWLYNICTPYTILTQPPREAKHLIISRSVAVLVNPRAPACTYLHKGDPRCRGTRNEDPDTRFPLICHSLPRISQNQMTLLSRWSQQGVVLPIYEGTCLPTYVRIQPHFIWTVFFDTLVILHGV
jgi:hypothetical protein